jgi:SpoVK/Ycf46/Vps4 family AAA+-type ATPase
VRCQRCLSGRVSGSAASPGGLACGGSPDAAVVAKARGCIAQDFGSEGVLFELLNQMEGLAEDEDLLFLLTTNRPDISEPALAARPGRIDLALEIPLPDRDGRRRLLALYGEGIDIDQVTERDLVERSDGVSGAFIKELTRQAWLRDALKRREGPTAEDLRRVLDELLEERSTLTRRLLGQPGGGKGIVQGGGAFPGMVHALNAAGLPVPPSSSTGEDPL